MNDYWGSGNFDAYIWYWSGDPDPNYQLFVFTSDQCGSWSDGCWKDSHFDKLYQEQHSMMDQTQRQARARRRSSTSTTRCRASCSRIPTGSRPTAPTSSRVGSASLVRVATCSRPTTTTRWLSLSSDGETTSQRLERRAWVGVARRRFVAIVGIVVVVMRRGRKIEPDEA